MQQRFDNHTFSITPSSVPININNFPSICTITDDVNILPIEAMFSDGRSSPLIASRSMFNASDAKVHI